MKFFAGKIFKIIIYVFALIGFVFVAVFIGMQFGILNVRGSNTARNTSLNIPKTLPIQDCATATNEKCNWNETAEWKVLKTAFIKDKEMINQVSGEVGISPLMLIATIAPEQIRFFTSNRETFKRYFEPLKLLVSLSKFSLGVSGIKEDTAKQIELYANDPTSPFYPGEGVSSLITYPLDVNHGTELFNRLTDEHNHYYSYLYTAIFIKEVENQWVRAGFDISKKAEIVATLFNLGFSQSMPKANPIVSGSEITLAGNTYIYGELGALVYNSNEFDTIFSR